MNNCRSMNQTKNLSKIAKNLISKIPSLTPLKEQVILGLIKIYHLNYCLIISKGDYYNQFALWEGNEKIVYEIVGPENLENMQYTVWQKNRFLELGFTIDEMFGNFQKIFNITKNEDLLEIVQLFNSVNFEIMALLKSTKFQFEYIE